MTKRMIPILSGALAVLLLGSGTVSASELVPNHSGLTPRKNVARSDVLRAQNFATPSSSSPFAKPPVGEITVFHDAEQPIDQPVLIEPTQPTLPANEGQNQAFEANAPELVAPQPEEVPAAGMNNAAPVVKSDAPGPDTYVYGELDRLAAEVASLKNAAKKAEPVVDNNAGGPDTYVYGELDRLAAEMASLISGAKKTDSKKSWETPKVTGRIFLDSFGVDQAQSSFDQYGNIKNAGGVREMQIAVSGKGFDSFDYKLEFSLAPNGGRVNLVDNWIGVKNVPLFGYVRAGHYKPETGLAYSTGALYTPLTEFVGSSAAFGLGRRVGVSSENLFGRDRIRLFMGAFQAGATNTDRYIQADDQGQVFNVRLSAAPMYAQDGRCVFHIGGHYSYVSPKADSTSMGTTIGSIGWMPGSITTGTFANDHHGRGGLELAYQAGPFSVQSEVYVAQFDGEEDRTANGAYVELKYFLTGEHRPYNLSKGVFDAAKVTRNFHPFKCGNYNLIDGFGAWQAVVQWSYLDLSDWRNAVGEGANGGVQNDLTLGMNWFWTPNIRWIFEYVHSQRNAGIARTHSSEDIFGTSLRLHF